MVKKTTKKQSGDNKENPARKDKVLTKKIKQQQQNKEAAQNNKPVTKHKKSNMCFCNVKMRIELTFFN